jgi:hypothetical protein
MNHISQEGVIDRAARMKTEAEAKRQKEIDGIKLQRALLATALLAVGGAAGYFYIQAGKAADLVTSLSESSQRDLTAAKAGADHAEKDLTSAKAKLTELESSRREESATLSAKVSMLEGQVATYRDEKVALQAKVDALQANSAPQVTVVGGGSIAGTTASITQDTPSAQETKKVMRLGADKDALATLANWSKSLDSYSKIDGPGPGTCSTYKRFRDWAKSNHALLTDRANAKGWSNDPSVRQSLRRLNQPAEKVDFTRAAIDGFIKARGTDTMAKVNKAAQVKWLAGFIEDGYADTQVCGYIMSDASALGTVKKCNE